ncbi:MAG: hypothetical protein K2H07_04585 [Lachnospiraceae bacterium]|nr:hypothetical protein [Lachnospiraceae bacterium]
MKRIIKYCVCLLVTVALAVGIFVAVKMNQKFSDEIVYSEYLQAFSEDGMYYVKEERLYFMDNATGEKAVVCNRANCEHNDNSCNAYIPGMGSEILVYGDYIYISYGDSDISINEVGGAFEAFYEGYSKLIRVRINGEGRKEIYTADSGAVINMIAMGDTIYFATWILHGEYQMNKNESDCAIYAYNIRWNKLKCIKNYPHMEEMTSEGIEIIGISDKGTLYIDYTYVKGEENSTESITVADDEELEDIHEIMRRKSKAIVVDKIEEINIKTGDSVELRTFENAYPHYFADKNKKYIQISDYETDILTMWECDDRFADVKELFTASAKDAGVNWLGGYMHVVASEYLKALYDCEENRWYIAKTSFTQKGTYISDTKKVDRDKNVIYIDATDYTGYKAGDLLPGDIRNLAVRDWSVFLEENYIPYEDLTEEQLKSLTWIDIK